MADNAKSSRKDRKVQAKREEVQRRLRESYEDYQRLSQRRSSESSPPGEMLGGSSPIGEGSRLSESSLPGEMLGGSSSREEGLPNPERIRSEVNESSESSPPGEMLGGSSSREEGQPNPERSRSEVNQSSESSLVRRRRAGSSPTGEGHQSSESSLPGEMQGRSSSVEGGQQPSQLTRKKHRKKRKPSESSSPGEMRAGIPNTGLPLSQNNPWQSASSSSGEMLGESSVPPPVPEGAIEEWLDYFHQQGYRSSADRLEGSSRRDKRSTSPARQRQVQGKRSSESPPPGEMLRNPSQRRRSSRPPARQRQGLRTGLRRSFSPGEMPGGSVPSSDPRGSTNHTLDTANTLTGETARPSGRLPEHPMRSSVGEEQPTGSSSRDMSSHEDLDPLFGYDDVP